MVVSQGCVMVMNYLALALALAASAGGIPSRKTTMS